MNRCDPLVMHHTEWQRLKGQANPTNPTKIPEKPSKCDIETMNKLSDKWVSAWPDSLQGRFQNLKLASKNQHMRDLAIVEEFRKKPKYDNTKLLKNARDKIFERSCYGQQLLTAIAESKAQEERDIQIRYKKEIKEQGELYEHQKPIVQNIMYTEFETEDTRNILTRKIQLDNSQFNKAIGISKKEDAKKAAELEKKLCEEDAVMMEKFRLLEIKQAELGSCIDIEGDLKYKAQTQMIREHRAKREAQEQAIADVWSKHQDMVRVKQECMIHQIHAEKHDTQRFKENYELVRQIQNRENKRFSDFIEKGVEACKKRMERKEREEEEKKERLKKSRYSEAKKVKVCLNFHRDYPARICYRSSGCPRQKVGSKICSPPKKERQPYVSASKPQGARQVKPAGRGGAGAAHAQFARAAGAALDECRYKGPVKKVIQEYRKLNEVMDLPIQNY